MKTTIYLEHINRIRTKSVYGLKRKEKFNDDIIMYCKNKKKTKKIK